MGNFTIFRAIERDGCIKTASSIMIEVAQWLENKGEKLWNPSFLQPEKLLESYSASEIYLGSLNHEPAVAFVLQLEDKLFWPNAPAHEGKYIHKLSVSRKFKGMGLADQTLDWCKSDCLKDNRKFMRLDCDANRSSLRNLYERNGFKQVDRRFVGTHDTAFYECNLESKHNNHAAI